MTAEESITQTAMFLLGKLGQWTTTRFAERLAPLGLRPRHCAVLEALADRPLAQLELSKVAGVTPSVVVDMLDELQELKAIRRVRDTADRRRHLVELTGQGRRLQQQAVRLAQQTDRELLDLLEGTEATALHQALGKIAAATHILRQ